MNTKRFRKTLEKIASPSSSDGEPLFLEIFLAAFRAVAKLFVMCLRGVCQTEKSVESGVDEANLSSLNGTIFLPCLLVTSIGASVTLEKLQKLWLLPVAACFNVICGYAFGRVLVFGNNKSNANNRKNISNIYQNAETISTSGVGELYVWERVGIAGGRFRGDCGEWPSWKFSVYGGG